MIYEETASKIAIDNKITGIYFLLKGSEVVYVGQSQDVHRRIFQHTKTKEFDYYSFIECESDYLSVNEAYFVLKYNPIYNKRVPENERFINVNKLSSTRNKKKVLEIVAKYDRNWKIGKFYYVDIRTKNI